MLDALIEFNQENHPSEEEILTESLWFSDWTKYETTRVKKMGRKRLEIPRRSIRYKDWENIFQTRTNKYLSDTNDVFVLHSFST